MNIDEVYDKLKEAIDGFVPEVEKTMHDKKDMFPFYVRDQLYSGLDGEGKPLYPTYSSDPWFNSNESGRWKGKAKAYRDWKKDKTPPKTSSIGFPARDIDWPNLYIEGNFHRSIVPVAINKGVQIQTQGFEDGTNIEMKYGSVIFEIAPLSRSHFIRTILEPRLINYFKKKGL